MPLVYMETMSMETMSMETMTVGGGRPSPAGKPRGAGARRGRGAPFGFGLDRAQRGRDGLLPAAGDQVGPALPQPPQVGADLALVGHAGAISLGPPQAGRARLGAVVTVRASGGA